MRLTDLDDHGRPDPPVAADETATILGFLEFQRATLAWKTSGLDAAGLQATVGEVGGEIDNGDTAVTYRTGRHPVGARDASLENDAELECRRSGDQSLGNAGQLFQ